MTNPIDDLIKGRQYSDLQYWHAGLEDDGTKWNRKFILLKLTEIVGYEHAVDIYCPVESPLQYRSIEV